MDDYSAWIINRGRDPLEMPSDRDLVHRRALRESRTDTGNRISVFRRMSATVRAAFKQEPATRPDAACCAA